MSSAGNDNKPDQVLKRPIQTVLTVEQREERVFNAVVSIYEGKGRIAGRRAR